MDGTYTNDISPTLSWNASTDTGGSGLRTTGTYNVTVTGTPSKDYYTPNLTYEPTLAEGAFTWSLHSRDNAGNDSAETATLNLYIDRTDPNDPSLGCSSHCVGTPSNDPNVCMTCGSATDPTSNGVASGVDGFEIAFDKNPTWTPDGLKDVEETWPGDTFTATSDGAWYFHLATVDNAGNWTSTEHFGPLDIDTVDPSVTDVAVDTDPVYEGDLTQFVTVTFNEPMLDDATADPTITFSAGTWTSAGDGGYDPTTIRIWTETFTLTDNEEENVGVTVDVTGAKDAAGNDQEDYTALPEFDIDVNRPSVSTVAVDTDPVYEGDLTQFVTVTLDEAMLDDDTADPVITFSAGATWTSAGDGAYDTTDKIWTETFTLTDNEEEAVGVTVDVTGARDAAGNLQEDYTPLPEFDVDVNKPSVIGVVIDTSPVYEGDLTQQVTVTFDEAMSTRTIPEIVFSHGAAWTEDTGSRLWSALDTVFTVTYTLADNDEEFYDRTPGVDVVTVDVTEAKDAAGNDQEDYAPQAEFDIDTLQPTLIDATSTSADGCYTTGANIDVSLIFSEDVHCFCPPMPHLFLRLVLDSGGARAATYHVRIDSFGFMGLTDTANGTYTVAADENSCDLTLLSCTWTGMWPESLTDWAGNEIDCAGPPPSSNIADHKEIVVDTTLPTAIQDPNGDEDRTASADSEIVVVRLDPYGQYRLAVRKNTPVYLDVKFNDTDLPCAVLLMIHDIPNPPANGSAWFDDPAGNIRYAPDEGYVGPDEFTYRIYDACGNISLEETAYIEVVPQLVVEDQYLSTCVDEPIEFDVTVADLFIPEEEFTFTIFDGPYHGVVLGDLDDLEEGLHGLTTNELETLTASLAYVPSEGYAGLDHVQLRIVDGFGGEVIAWIDIAVGGCGPPDGGPPGPDVHADPGDILPMVVPLTFAVIHETAWASVTLTSVETGISYAGALSAVWSEEIGRFVLSVDSTGLPPGEYLLVIPLGNDETVTLVIEVGES